MKFRRTALVACGVAALALAACDPPLEPADAPAASGSVDTANLPEGFSNDLQDDVSGYYRPTTEVRQASWRLVPLPGCACSQCRHRSRGAVHA